MGGNSGAVEKVDDSYEITVSIRVSEDWLTGSRTEITTRDITTVAKMGDDLEDLAKRTVEAAKQGFGL